jgi:ATP-binding cassette subfamily B multidrug efflux pump
MEKTLRKNLQGILSFYRRRLLKAIFGIIIANGLLVLIPLVFRQAVIQMDRHIAKSNNFLEIFLQFALGNYIHSVYAWALLLLILSIIAAYFKFQMRKAFISISRDAERNLRSKIFARIQKQSMAFYDRHGIGDLISRLTNDISIYRDVLGPGLMYPLLFITIVFPGLGALFYISKPLATIALIPLFVIPIVNFAMRNAIYKASHKVQKGLADLSNTVQESFSGIRSVKGYAVESGLIDIFKEVGSKLIKINIKLSACQGLLFPFFTVLTRIVTVVLVMVASLVVFRAWGNLTTADFAAFMWIQSYIFFPILMLSWIMPIYSRGQASYERILEIYNEPIEVEDENIIYTSIPENADIDFKDLTFSYSRSVKPVLNNFSLYISAGSFVGITGPVGSGKTTLFRLLNREYEIPRGKISIGGHDIHDYSLEALGKSIVTVEQLPFLFSRTIADNVRFGKENAQLDEVQLVSKYADLHETILDFPEQYETVIGERGVTLSGGQKQRVAMARAFLVNGNILLLDDVFSALDAKTEAFIFETIQTKFKGKTILLVTHRPSVLEMMDRVIYLEKGRVIEDGSPEQLKSMDGKYAAMIALHKFQG